MHMYTVEATKSELPYHLEVTLHYKTCQCSQTHPQIDSNLNDTSNSYLCRKFHDPSERRRPVLDEKTQAQAYEPKWCSSFKATGECRDQDSCRFAHTQNEIDYHPLNYKTNPCFDCQFPTRQSLCPNYHADEKSRAIALEKHKMKKSRENSSQRQGGDHPGQKGFNLDTFKTKQCTSKGNHNPKVCLFFHSDKDKRRSLKNFKYGCEPCPWKNENCPKGDNCEFAHNLVEQLYHPEKYKKKFCSLHPHRVQDCEYGAYCSFAHSESEIKIELLHNLKKDKQFYVYKYKTIFCPYNTDHDRNQCLYAHNPQDFRRDPQNFKYNPVKCQYWTQKPISSYEKGNCPKLMGCENCHGWKEFEYHPANYKTKTCINDDCEKPDCPHFHQGRDGKEIVTTEIDFGAIAPPKQNFSNSAEKIGVVKQHYDNFKVRGQQSNFYGPIKPFLRKEFELNKQERQINPSSQFGDSESTRPNSTASSKNHLDGGLSKRFSKKKKQMSMQNKKEDFSNPLPTQGGPTQSKIPKRGSSAEFNYSNSQFSKQEKAHDDYEENKGEFKNQNPVSLESLDGLIIDKNSDNFKLIEPSSDIYDEQFRWNLWNALEREGLAYTIPYLLSQDMDSQALRWFNFRDFNKFPLILFEHKERIVHIIAALIEDEKRTLQLNYDFQRGFASPTYFG